MSDLEVSGSVSQQVGVCDWVMQSLYRALSSTSRAVLMAAPRATHRGPGAGRHSAGRSPAATRLQPSRLLLVANQKWDIYFENPRPLAPPLLLRHAQAGRARRRAAHTACSAQRRGEGVVRRRCQHTGRQVNLGWIRSSSSSCSPSSRRTPEGWWPAAVRRRAGAGRGGAPPPPPAAALPGVAPPPAAALLPGRLGPSSTSAAAAALAAAAVPVSTLTARRWCRCCRPGARMERRATRAAAWSVLPYRDAAAVPAGLQVGGCVWVSEWGGVGGVGLDILGSRLASNVVLRWVCYGLHAPGQQPA